MASKNARGLALMIATLALAAAARAQVKPFGVLDCAPQDGVRFCAGSVAMRVPSFDGVPLDDARIHAWFDRWVKHDHHAAPLRGVEVLTQTCPSSAASGGPFQAATWRDLYPGEVRFADATTRLVLSTGDTLGSQVDPIAGGGACVRTSATDQPAAATYRLPAATGAGYTLLGAPTVIANIALTAAAPENAELAARLWDVASDGMQTLVARELYRPSANGAIVNANAWHFDAGHVAKLELLGSDAPYGRASNFAFTLAVSNLELRLPTHEPPDGGQILPPAPR
jgi:hypothetical protein